MFENEKISTLQFFILVFFFTIGNTVINAPSLIVSQAKQDAWISSTISLGFGLCLVLFYCYLASKFPNKTIVQFSEIILGKIVGKIFSLFLIFFFLIIASLMIRQFGDFMTTIIMPETPSLAIHLLFLTIIVTGAYLGIETLGRSGEVILPTLLVLLALQFLFLFPELDIDNIKPIYENGFNPIMRGTISNIGIPYLQLIVILMIFPFVEDNKKAKNIFILGVFLGGVILIVIILYSILTLGVILSEIKYYPPYFMAQKISIGDIVERLEVLISGTWFITIFFKTTILLYAVNLGLSQVFNYKNSRPMIFGLSYLLLILTQFITPNVVYFNDFFKKIFPPYTLTFGFLFPLLLLSIYLIRRKNLFTYHSK
ncbi:endospore germination permease [Anaerobacillus sp. CMMVII]|uniref:GerAB/ArcD/ProY family transporter n=1 Tax=Anaerobacillus sp. CMMVII TaxID=2755588 RepID=UPI0021B822CE|nr:spore germination protein [Anaerobacillus sp. CMMVII]MCT8139426.1 endospore germination permease [Anaerobacillus sp. CMMVII]